METMTDFILTKSSYVPYIAISYYVSVFCYVYYIFKSLKSSVINIKEHTSKKSDIFKVLLLLFEIIFFVVVFIEFANTNKYFLYHGIEIRFPSDTFILFIVYPAILTIFTLMILVRYIVSKIKGNSVSPSMLNLGIYLFMNAIVSIHWLLFIFILLSLNGFAQL